MQVGLGDYQHDFEYEGEFDPWVKAILEKIEGKIGKKLKSQ